MPWQLHSITLVLDLVQMLPFKKKKIFSAWLWVNWERIVSWGKFIFSSLPAPCFSSQQPHFIDLSSTPALILSSGFSGSLPFSHFSIYYNSQNGLGFFSNHNSPDISPSYFHQTFIKRCPVSHSRGLHFWKSAVYCGRS